MLNRKIEVQEAAELVDDSHPHEGKIYIGHICPKSETEEPNQTEKQILVRVWILYL